jgi:hypothetical protein
MVLADRTGPGELRPDDREWTFIEGWADELGLRTGDALERINSSPAWAAAERQGDREAGE